MMEDRLLNGEEPRKIEEGLDMSPPESLLKSMEELLRVEVTEKQKQKVEKHRRLFGEDLELDLTPPDSLFKELSSLVKNSSRGRREVKSEKVVAKEVKEVPATKEEPSVPQPLGLITNPPDVKAPDALTPLNQKFATMKDLEDHYKLFLNRIQQQLSTLGGGGESNITFLDTPVTIVTSSSYQVKTTDYYIGVNHAGITTITLPSPTMGKRIVVKDESGEASWKNRQIRILPFSASDAIDGEDEAILQIDHGSLTFLYREGWRII